MHSSYASGFLYHPNSGQFLLQQQNSSGEKATWTLLGSPSQGGKTSEENFQRIAHKLLKLKLPARAIHNVYDYYHAAMRKKHFISYAEVSELNKFPATEKFSFAWFTMKEILKLSLSSQTKQDIVVGQRVIDAQVRKRAGERSIE